MFCEVAESFICDLLWRTEDPYMQFIVKTNQPANRPNNQPAKQPGRQPTNPPTNRPTSFLEDALQFLSIFQKIISNLKIIKRSTIFLSTWKTQEIQGFQKCCRVCLIVLIPRPFFEFDEEVQDWLIFWDTKKYGYLFQNDAKRQKFRV